MRRLALRRTGATAKPWFWLVTSTRPVRALDDRVVRAAVAERELERLVPGRERRAAGGRGRCRARACGRAAPARSRPRRAAAPGRRGRSRAGRRRSRRARRRRRRAGRRSRRRPRRRGGAGSSASRRSRRPRRGRGRSAAATYGRARRDGLDERAPLHVRLRARPRASASATGTSPATATARIAPPSRSRRTSERVSIPVRPTMPRSRSQSVHSGPRASRMSAARACGRSDSSARVGDAVVADHRRREADELLGVARVGDGLLVAGHRRREDRLAEGDPLRGDRLAVEDRAVLEQQVAAHAANTTLPSAIVLRDGAAQALAEQPRVGRARAEAVLGRPSTRRRGRARRGSRRSPTAIRGTGRPNARAGPGRHPLEQRREREHARHDEVRVQRGERRLEPGDAERRRLERRVLLLARVRRVVGGDAGDRAVAQRVDERGRGRRRCRAAGSSSCSGRASATASSVRTRWCGVASPVAADALGARAPERLRPTRRAERCMRCSGRSSCRASARSRSTITLSATDGQPATPSSAETGPSRRCPSPESDALLAVERERAAVHGAVPERAPHEPGRRRPAGRRR